LPCFFMGFSCGANGPRRPSHAYEISDFRGQISEWNLKSEL
jgi:hypothetical protein